MSSRVSLLILVPILALVGCLADDKKLPSVSSSPFSKLGRTQTASFKQAPPATQEVALRVDRVGQKLVAANARLKQQKVAFLTMGVSQLEIFHQGQDDSAAVYITEGLVKQCKTDDELAAVLSQELGKLMSEQLAQAQPMRNREQPPPQLTPRIGNDLGGTFGPADGTDQMILARYEKDHKQSRPALIAPPPPETLARGYLQSAGYDIKALATVAPLLRQADKENSLEQSMTAKP
jgi:predicted Zn-dependent protease